MDIQKEVAQTAGKIVREVDKCIEESVKFAKEQAYLATLKMEMEQEVKEMISEEKSRFSKLEESLHQLFQDMSLISDNVSATAEGKTADKAIENLNVIKTKIYEEQMAVKSAVNSCKTYTWLE